MVKLHPVLDSQIGSGLLGIAVIGDEILVSKDLMGTLQALNIRSGEELYSILAEYPQALPASRSLSSAQFSGAVGEAMARIGPLLPQELVSPSRERYNYRFGAAIPRG